MNPHRLQKFPLRRWQGKPDGDGKRPSVYLGRCSNGTYSEIKIHLDRLQAALRFGSQVPDATNAWLTSIDAVFHAKISTAGLCVSRVKSAPGDEPVVQFVPRYIARRSDVGERTRVNLRQAEAKLSEFFGPAKSMASVTLADGKAFRQWLEGQGYALATISMYIKKARQFFGHAVDDEILPRNPFRKVQAGSQVNAANMRYVSAATVERVMAVADPAYRLVLALARYAGLRCPSELLQLRWDDVRWDEHWLHVLSDKTKKQAKPERFPPLCGRLKAVLREAFAGVDDVQSRVLPFLDKSSNLRTQVRRLCKRAGVEPWPKPLQNLRLSCETDWLDSDGVALACKWSGNTPEVAMKHYHLVREKDYQRVADRGAESSAEWCRIEGNGAEGQKVRVIVSDGSSQTYYSVPFHSLAGTSHLVPPMGIEPIRPCGQRILSP